jgi:hypothetical protein
MNSPEQRSFDLRRAWCLMPLLLLLVVFLIGELVRPAAGFFTISYDVRVVSTTQCADAAPANPIQMRHPRLSLEAFGNDVDGRMRWAAAAVVTIALGLMTLIVSGLVIGRRLRAGSRHSVRLTIRAMVILIVVSALAMTFDNSVVKALPAAICIVCVLLAFWGHATNRALGFVASVFLPFAVAAWVVTQLPIAEWLTESHIGDRYRTFAVTTPLFDRLQTVLYASRVGWPLFDRAVGGLSTLVVVTLAIAVCALVAECGHEPSEEAQLREHAESVGLLQYLGGGVLVAAVVYVKMLHDWPLPLLCGDEAKMLFTNLSNHWSVIVGTYWTLMLVAIFTPAQITLARTARQLARARLRGEKGPASEKSVDEWLDERGLRASPAKQITQFVAILGPWLTSVPLAAVFDSLKGLLGG